MAQIADLRDDVKLFFAGVQHPSPDVPPMRMCQAAMSLSDSLGLTNRVVFFNDWVSYEQRGAYLLDADVGVSLHLAHVETRYSFRTRLLDYLWAGLPMVVTAGDTISGWVQRESLGQVVAPEDVDGVKTALLNLLDTSSARMEMAPRFQALREGLHWSQVARPLLDYCENPYCAADRMQETQSVSSRSLWRRVGQVLRERGVMGLVREVRSYLAWRLRTR